MPILRQLPVILALLLLAAHFFRAGWIVLVPLCLGLATLSFVRLAWVPRVLGLALLLAAAEWLRVLWVLAAARIAAGEPYARLAGILLFVAVATLVAALPLRSTAVRNWYRGESDATAD